MPIQKECIICGKYFLVKFSAFDRLKTCSYECRIKNRSNLSKGSNHPMWKGGKEIKNNGYIHIYCPEHPKSHKGKVAEHRLIMEKSLGRYLKENEHVHHLNHNKQDNRLENLQIMAQSKHTSLHMTGRPSWIKGKHHSEATKNKMSKIKMGKRLKEYYKFECKNCNKIIEVMPCEMKRNRQFCSHKCQQLKRWKDAKDIKTLGKSNKTKSSKSIILE